MAKTKRNKRARRRHANSSSIRVDLAVLLAVLDELNDLAELLRCVPELNVLSSCLRARQTGRATTAATGHDRIADMAREHFGRDLDVIDRAQREKDAVAYESAMSPGVVHHARYVTFQLAEVAVPRRLYRAILERIRRFAALSPRAALI